MSLHYASMKTEDLRPDVLPAHSPQLVPAAQRLEQGPPCEHLGWGKLPLWEGIQRDHKLQAAMGNAGGELVCRMRFEPAGVGLLQRGHVRSHPMPLVPTRCSSCSPLDYAPHFSRGSSLVLLSVACAGLAAGGET